MAVSRRQFLQTGAVAGLGALQTRAVAGLGARSTRTQQKRPNILFIQTDDQRFDDLSCMGNRVLHTPNIDRLAEQGIRFRNAFVTTAICCCSRASVLTGQHMKRHRVRDFQTPLSEAQFANTYAALLRKAGYRTAYLGKYAIGFPEHSGQALSLPGHQFDFWYGFPQDFEFRQIVDGKERHLTPLMVEKAIDFLRSNPADRPFCISLNFKEPHGPWNYFDPDRPWLYADAAVPPPATFTKADFEAQPEFIRTSLCGTADGQWPQNATERFLRQARIFFHLVKGVDEAVGKVTAALRELNLDDNTVIIFTSDNGSMRGAHGLIEKWLMYEESIRVPLIIRDPNLPAKLRGSTRDQMALNIDHAPTMLSLAGVPVPALMQGRDLTPVLHDPNARWREDWYYEHTFAGGRRHIPKSEGVRTTRWKYIHYLEMKPEYEQLFDLKADPLERHNLATEPAHRKMLAALRARCDQLRREAA